MKRILFYGRKEQLFDVESTLTYKIILAIVAILVGYMIVSSDAFASPTETITSPILVETEVVGTKDLGDQIEIFIKIKATQLTPSFSAMDAQIAIAESMLQAIKKYIDENNIEHDGEDIVITTTEIWVKDYGADKFRLLPKKAE